MLYVLEDGTIKLTRGDTARLSMGTVTNTVTHQPYTIQNNDTLELSVKKNVKDTTALIHKTVTGNGTFHIQPTDTKELSFGSYIYDVQLTTSSGDVYTIVEPTGFEILKEVT